jgi:hypothetical protein
VNLLGRLGEGFLIRTKKEKHIMKFQGESFPMRDSIERPPDSDHIPETDPPKNTDPMSDEAAARAEEQRQAGMNAFVKASDARRGRKSAPSRDALSKMTPAQRFAAWSDFRRRR